MNIGIVGSRTFNNLSYLCNEVDNIIKGIKENITIVSGGAYGADRLAEVYARKNNYDLKVFFPDWKTYGKKAGYLRNINIVENSDIIIAFWDGKSKGTKHSIDLAEKKSKKIYIKLY
jgi:GH18 family chitinase